MVNYSLIDKYNKFVIDIQKKVWGWLMNYLDKFRYSFDNLEEINTKPKVQKKLIISKK